MGETLKKAIRIALLCLACGVSTVGMSSYAASTGFHSPIVDAVDAGDEPAVMALLKNGYAVDTRGDFDVTPLMRAAYKGHVRLVKLLLRLGADVNARDVASATPLHLAARQGNEAVVKLLLDAGAEVNARDAEGWTPLMRAASMKQPLVMKDLLEYKADPALENTEGDPVLLHAVRSNDVNTVRVLVEEGAIAKDNSFLQSAIDTAARKGNTAMVELLQQVSAKGEQGGQATPAQEDAGAGQSGGAVYLSGADDEPQQQPVVGHVPDTDNHSPGSEGVKETDLEQAGTITVTSPEKKVQVLSLPKFLALEDKDSIVKIASLDELKAIPLEAMKSKEKAINAVTEPAVVNDTKPEKQDIKTEPSEPIQIAPKEILSANDTKAGKQVKNEVQPVPAQRMSKTTAVVEKIPSQPVRPAKVDEKKGAVAQPVLIPASVPEKATMSETEDKRIFATVHREHFYTVQFGKYNSRMQAEKSWAALQASEAVLNNAVYNIHVSGTGQPSAYTIDAGAFKKKIDATRVCVSLWKKKMDCFVKETYLPTDKDGKPVQMLSAGEGNTLPEDIASSVKKEESASGAENHDETISSVPSASSFDTDAILAAEAMTPEEEEVAAILRAYEKNHEVVKKKEAKVEVAEAIPVKKGEQLVIPQRVAEKKDMPVKQEVAMEPALLQKPVAITQAHYKATVQPTVTEYWTQVGNFPTQKVAIDFVNVIRQNASIHGKRMRVIKLAPEAQRNEPAIAIQVGVFASKAEAEELCSASLSYLQCKAVQNNKGTLSQ